MSWVDERDVTQRTIDASELCWGNTLLAVGRVDLPFAFDRRGGLGADLSPPARVGLDAVVVRWREILELEAIEPWPCLQLTWRHAYGQSAERYAPREKAESKQVAMAEAIEELFAFAGRRIAVKRGWLELPEAPWEAVSSLPAEAPPAGREMGAFRTASPARTERIVARRTAPLPEQRLAWWRITGQRRLGELVLTETHLYRTREGVVERIPRSALRNVRVSDTRPHDAVATFGRRTSVYLPDPGDAAPCPILTALRSQLTEHAPSSSRTALASSHPPRNDETP